MAALPIKKGVYPLVVITGPTASGKTALAIEVAEKFAGEIICADSRTIYTGMDIGTAKPTTEERARVPHWGLDLVRPGEYFSAADFKIYAEEKIKEIRSRGHLPLLVGGTGLYIDSVLFNYQFGPVVDVARRAELEKMSLEELYEYCEKNNIDLPENERNKRYVVRAVELKNVTVKRRNKPIDNCFVVGIDTDRDILRTRIRDRTEQLFGDNVVGEATILGKRYGWNNEAMTGNVYPLVRSYLEDRISLDEVKDKFTTLDWRLAKRQLTWLRRNPYIRWGSLFDTREYLFRLLANK
jgi:tRNA dimethylallyltransferase